MTRAPVILAAMLLPATPDALADAVVLALPIPRLPIGVRVTWPVSSGYQTHVQAQSCRPARKLWH